MRASLTAAVRSLVRRPGVSLAVVLTLALGIGANSTIFSAVDAVLLAPLPYPSGDRLVAVYERNLAGGPRATQLVAPGRLEDWNAQNRTFDGLAASYFENMTDTSGASPERVEAMRTSPRFFDVLAVPAALGRTPLPGEERFGGACAVVISDRFWERRFHRDPQTVGGRLALGTTGCTVVGVMPPSFRYPTATTDVWVPTRAPAFFLAARQARLYTAFGRMKPGVTIGQAAADLDAVQARLGDRYPATDRGWGASLVLLKEEQIGGVRQSLWFLLAAVALVLLAACGNVACLLLADSTGRSHEIAIRYALGASRGRITRDLFVEGVVLALGGAVSALFVATWGISALRAAAPGLPRIDSVRLDLRLIVLTLAVGLSTTLLFALAPAVQAGRADPAGALSRGGRGHTSGRRTIQQALVGAQVALAVVLLTGAGLMLRSFVRLHHLSPGFDPAHVVTFRMTAAWSERSDAVVQRHARTLARLTQLAGVEAAAVSQLLPAAANVPPGEFHIVGRSPGEQTFADARTVSAGYFRTLGVPILQGETCSGDPGAPLYATVLVNRSFAARLFPDGTPIGHELAAPWMPPGQRSRIIGIVGDVSEDGVAAGPRPVIYWCGYNPFWPDPFFVVRVAPEHGATIADMRAALREVEPRRAMYAVRPLADTLDESNAQYRLNAVLLTAFALAALALASMGLYGVLAQLLASRRREIGVRAALGASRRHLVRVAAGPAIAATIAGVCAGLVGALALGRFASALLFGVSARDPLTLATAPIVLVAAAAVSAIVPARRAAAVEPMEVLRL